MTRLCERPGCSEPAAVVYGFEAQRAYMWLAALEPAEQISSGVLCRRHADAMVVPRGWTLDDRREGSLRLFRPPAAAPVAHARQPRRSPAASIAVAPEQLELDDDERTVAEVVAEVVAAVSVDTPDEVPGEVIADDAPIRVAIDDGDETAALPWRPDFDADDDLGGLLHARSPLLARAFRGTDRPAR